MSTEQDAARLKEFIRRIAPGGCRMLSQGDGCECLLCAVDRLHAAAAEATRQLTIERVGINTMTVYAAETREHWDADRDMKVGKRLLAMAGDLPGYNAELDAIHKHHPKPSDDRAICEQLGFDPTNHHNAAKCPYCTLPPATQ